MPNNYDFSTLNDVKTEEISPAGWINPVTVEYGIGNHLMGNAYFWRVKDTEHTFVIPVLRLNYITSGNYAEHFTEVLENFRENDYNKWKEDGFIVPWQRRYEKEYQNFIL